MIKVFKELTRSVSGSNFILQPCAVVDIKAFNKKIEDFNPEQHDVIYTSPGSSIPSTKLKDFVVSHSIRRTNSLDKANTVVLSKENIYEYLKTEHYYILNRKELVECIVSLKENSSLYDVIINLLNVIDDEYILVDYSNNRFLENHFNFSGTLENYRKFHIVSSSKLSAFETLIQLKIVSETSILKNINGKDSVEINQDLYEQLCNMMESTDADNKMMAMEIMANCHYMKSLLYLFLLFEKYSFKFEDSPTKRHINFKSLLSMLNFTSRNLYMNIDHMIEVMIKYNQLSKEKLDFLLENLTKDYNINLNGHGNNHIRLLELSEISIPNKKLTEILGYTYTYKIPQNGNRVD